MAYRSFVLKDREVLVVKPVAKDVPRELPSLDPLNELVEVVATGVTWGDRAIVGFLGRMDRAERSPAVGRGRRDKIGCQQGLAHNTNTRCDLYVRSEPGSLCSSSGRGAGVYLAYSFKKWSG